LTFLLIASLSGHTVFAQDVVEINKGTPAPFSGILFSEQKANDMRFELLELDKTKVKLESRDEQLKLHKTMLDLKSSEIELYKKQNDRLERTNSSSNMLQYIAFGLGVFLTGAAVYGAGGLSR